MRPCPLHGRATSERKPHRKSWNRLKATDEAAKGDAYDRNKQTSTTKTDRRPDCVTEIRMGNSVLVVSGFFKQGATDTAADKMMKVLEAEAATQKTGDLTDRKEADLTLLPLYRQPPHVVQSRYGIVGLAVGNGGFYVKTDQPNNQLPPFTQDYPMRTSCKARAIPFPTRSVFLKPMQSRTAFPICAGTRTTVILVRTFKDPVFKPCLRTLKPEKSGQLS